MSSEDLIEWAEGEAARLERVGLRGDAADVYPSAFAAEACQFLRQNAPGTVFLEQAEEVAARGRVMGDALMSVAQNLRSWCAFKRAGMIEVRPFEQRAREEAATDLMEQVQVLLDDRSVHPAAPVMLAGAALEEALRGLIEAQPDLSLPGGQKPSINVYASALQKAEVLSRQQVKEITAWAGRRNEAAHGHFDEIDATAARHMADGVNLFLQRLAT